MQYRFLLDCFQKDISILLTLALQQSMYLQSQRRLLQIRGEVYRTAYICRQNVDNCLQPVCYCLQNCVHLSTECRQLSPTCMLLSTSIDRIDPKLGHPSINLYKEGRFCWTKRINIVQSQLLLPAGQSNDPQFCSMFS